MKDRKVALLDDVKKFLEENGRFPSWSEIERVIGVPRRTVRRFFGTRQVLFEQVLAEGEPIFTEARTNSVKEVIRNHKVFFISTAVAGAPVFENGMKTVRNYCKRRNGASLIIPCADPAADSVSMGMSTLLSENLIVENTDLNSNLGIFTIRLSAKQINPTTGLGRLGQRNKSVIFASPKQSLEFVSVGNNAHPHALMSTGAITMPAYDTERYMSKRTAFIANHDHVMGGLIVEVENDRFYHFRQVQFNADGSFTDLGKRYYPNGQVQVVGVLNMTLGDRHVGHTCPMVSAVTDQMIRDLTPESLVLHDLFNGDSVNHHVLKKPLSKARMKFMTLLEEGQMVHADLTHLSSFRSVKKLHVVKSNHDEWIDRYLQEFRFKEDTLNLSLALKLASAVVDGIDPLKELMTRCGSGLNKVNFLGRDEDLIMGEIQYGCHGDFLHRGMNYEMAENAYGKATLGHRHTAGIRRGIYFVGTSTKLRESYATGPISWTNTHELLNHDNSRQLIHIYNGKYKLDE